MKNGKSGKWRRRFLLCEFLLNLLNSGDRRTDRIVNSRSVPMRMSICFQDTDTVLQWIAAEQCTEAERLQKKQQYAEITRRFQNLFLLSHSILPLVIFRLTASGSSMFPVFRFIPVSRLRSYVKAANNFEMDKNNRKRESAKVKIWIQCLLCHCIATGSPFLWTMGAEQAFLPGLKTVVPDGYFPFSPSRWIFCITCFISP